jgi:hypothetical protein
MRYFVIRGFGVKKDSAGQAFDFDRVDRELIAPALARAGLLGGTTGMVLDAGSIHADMFEMILHADMAICDISVHNANVFYELGVRHALRKKSTVMIKAAGSKDSTPFDVGGFRYIAYDAEQPAARIDDLAAAIAACRQSDRPTDSPVFQFLPGLAEARPDEVCQAPRDYIEAVELATAARDGARLEQLAADAARLRYPWSGLCLVARAQFKLKLFDAARRSWEQLSEVNAHALEAELVLGNIYERLSRNATGPAKAELLERSNQALRAALASPKIGNDARGEALAQQARNLKTLWRMEWSQQPDVQARREHALHRMALECFDDYREAFEADLNGCYRGLAALQMGVLLRDLAREPGWEDLHDSAEAAAAARTALDRACNALAHVVDASIRRTLALTQGEGRGEERMWAEISRADLLFLTEPEPPAGAPSRRVNQAYRAAVPPDHGFAREAAVGQLALFRDLGFRPGMAQAAIDLLSPPAAAPEPGRG